MTINPKAIKKETIELRKNHYSKWGQVFGRDLLYTQLTERFGHYNTWGNKGYPENRKEEYIEFKKGFAKTLSFLSGTKTEIGGVENQIAWAITGQDKVEGKAHYYNIILNQAAAIKAGFLESKDLPDYTLYDREKER